MRFDRDVSPAAGAARLGAAAGDCRTIMRNITAPAPT
jgi:hypothetical protein